MMRIADLAPVVSREGTRPCVDSIRPDKQTRVSWRADDPRLLRAARRLIRLYDLHHCSLFTVNPASLAQVIAQELNHDIEQRDTQSRADTEGFVTSQSLAQAKSFSRAGDRFTSRLASPEKGK